MRTRYRHHEREDHGPSLGDGYGQRSVFTHGWLQGDLDDDGVVGDDDFAAWLVAYNQAQGTPAWLIRKADLNGDGLVDTSDYTFLSLYYWGWFGRIPFDDGLVTHPTLESYREPLAALWGATDIFPIGHQGLYQDKETDTIHNRARTLRPRDGRFNQTDPRRYVDGMSLYQCARSTPVRFTDPLGLTVAEREMWQNMINELQGWINAGSPDATYHTQTISMLHTLITFNQWQEHDLDASGGTHQQHYNYGQEQDLRAKLRERLAIDAASVFVVIGSAIRGNEKDAQVARTLGLRHVDVYYNGQLVRVGFGGGVDRARQNAITDKHLWFDTEVTRLERLGADLQLTPFVRVPYSLEAGKAKGKCCKDVIDAEIVDSLRSYPATAANCHADVIDALFGSCLTGYWGIGYIEGGIKSTNYWLTMAQGYLQGGQ